MNKTIHIYTDGACRGNPGPGGWGAVLFYNKHEKHIRGACADTTNNRMELTAAIKALSQLKQPCNVILTTDSKYVKQGITEWLNKWEKNGWKTTTKKPVKNIELWKELNAATKRHNIKWKWVKGHAGHPENELADTLANQAIDKLLAKT